MLPSDEQLRRLISPQLCYFGASQELHAFYIFYICSHKMPSVETKPRTLYDKVFDDHIVNEQEDGTCLLYIGMSESMSRLIILALTPGKYRPAPCARGDISPGF